MGTRPVMTQIAVDLVAEGAATGGAYSVFDVRAPAGASVPAHVHRDQLVILHVLEGELELVSDERRVLGLGDHAVLPAGEPWQATAFADARVLCLGIPAGGELLAALAEPDLGADDVAALVTAAGVTVLPAPRSTSAAATEVRLVRATLELLDAALAGDEVLARVLGHRVAPGWATFRDALAPTRDALADDPGAAAWGSRLFVTDDPPELVGWGGFKGPPDDGRVEIGYEIADARRGRGLASAATRAMAAEAFADEQVNVVLAHTLAERNASNRVLEKAGFRFDGEAREDGEVVWRYVLPRPPGT